MNKFEFKIIKLGNKYTSIYDIIRFSKLTKKSNKLRNFTFNLLMYVLYLFIKIFSLENKQDSFYSGFLLICSKK